jgi:uroporphyrinogen decarboxylase
MTSRERLLTALRHREPDRVPYDLASTQVTGISRVAYDNLRRHLGMPAVEPDIMDAIQQVVIPHDDLMARLEVDTRGLYARIHTNWNAELAEDETFRYYHDEWGMIHRMSKEEGLYYSLWHSPLDETMLTMEAVEKHAWPDPADPRRFEGLREKAQAIRAAGFPVVMKAFCAGIMEMACRVRPMDMFLMDLAMSEAEAVALMRRIMELKAAYWEAALDGLGDLVDVVAEADDYGTQESMLIRPEMYRRLIKPLQAELFQRVRAKLADGFIFFHSCGNVRGLIPDFIEIGVDVLNPVHISATGMAPAALKADFGKDICFWGGGVETQHVLPRGTPRQVRDDVKRNVEALMPGGGYVFNTVHNIQADVPPENVMAMVEALREVGDYL